MTVSNVNNFAKMDTLYDRSILYSIDYTGRFFDFREIQTVKAMYIFKIPSS